MKRSYDVKDPVVDRVLTKFTERSNEGFRKYGQSLDNERRNGLKNLVGYLNDIQEELMDAVLYIQAAREELADLSDEALVDKFREENMNDNKEVFLNWMMDDEKCCDPVCEECEGGDCLRSDSYGA